MVFAKEGEDVYVTETVYNRETKLPVFMRVSLNGKSQTPPDGSPAEIQYDELGRPEIMRWLEQGVPHRLDGPSRLSINPENGIHIVETYSINGVPRDRHIGPSMIVRDRESGEITKQEFEKPSSPKGPSI